MGVCYIHYLNILALVISLACIFGKRHAGRVYFAVIVILDTLLGIIIAYMGHCNVDWWLFAANVCITAEAAWGKKYFEHEPEDL